MLEIPSRCESAELSMEVRVRYFAHFLRTQHHGEIRFLLDDAKLGKRPRKVGEHFAGWNNVMKHNVGEAAAMRALCKNLDISEDEAMRLETYAFVHNPTIHRDKFIAKKQAGADLEGLPASEVFEPFEDVKLIIEHHQLMKRIDPDGAFQLATSPEFFDAIAARQGENMEEKALQMPFEDLLVYYIDALFDDGNLLAAHDRIAKMERRRPDLNEDHARTERLGMKYWDAERRVSSGIERAIWEKLQERGIELPASTEIPKFILGQMREDMRAHWETTGGNQQEKI